MWPWLGIAQAEPLGGDEVAAFLEWHCSMDNVHRYDGDLLLAEAPSGGAPDRVPIRPYREIGASGLTAPAGRADTFRTVAIAADAPVAVVAQGLDQLAERLELYEVRGVLLALPDTYAPRPPPPVAGVLDRLAADGPVFLDEDHARRHYGAQLRRASERCPEAGELMAAGACVEAAAQLAADLQRRRCRMDPVDALTAWARGWHRGDGPPVQVVEIRVGDPVAGDGTWGTTAVSLLDHGVAMRGRRPPGEPIDVTLPADRATVEGAAALLGTTRMFHQNELEVASKVVPTYPAEASRLELAEQRCRATVWIDVDGIPLDVVVESCASVFHAPIREALVQWRWFPPRYDGEPTIAVTAIQVMMQRR